MRQPTPREQVATVARLAESIREPNGAAGADGFTKPRGVVLAAGFLHEVSCRGSEQIQIKEIGEIAELLRCYGQEEVVVLALGPGIPPQEMHSLLTRVNSAFPDRTPYTILIGAGPDLDLFQPLIDSDRIYYLSRGAMTSAQVRSIIGSAVAQSFVSPGLASVSQLSANLLNYCDQLFNQVDAPSVGELLAEAVCNLANAERSQCLIYDPAVESLWSINPTTHEQREESPAAGVVGYVARTGESVHLDHLRADPRFDLEADDPGGSGNVRFFGLPIPSNRPTPLGVVTALRPCAAPEFSSDDIRTIELLVEAASSTLNVILLQRRVAEKQLHGVLPTGKEAVFRQEALDHFSLTGDEEGDVLEGAPLWLRRTHWVTLALLLAALLYLILARVDERAVGPAMIRARSKVAVVATTNGLVHSVETTAGAEVRAGDLLVRFEDALGSSTIENFNRQLRAPGDGVITDVRVRPGQQVAQGDQVASIVDESSGYELVAFLPGSFAPQIHQGLPIVFKIVGYSDSYEVVIVNDVGTEILSPREALRYSGADSMTFSGPVVIARSFLGPSGFSVGERTFSFHDGMTATAEVSVRSESMIVSLFPGMKGLLRSVK